MRARLKTAIDNTRLLFKGFYEYPFIKKTREINKLTKELFTLNTTNLKVKTKKEKEKIEILQEENLNTLSHALKCKINDFDNIYNNAFEWRFEFPEIIQIVTENF